jgi:FAD-dependent urate hydroxylase
LTEGRNALIAGGGIAGPVAAMALQHAQIETTVFEAHDDTADGVGAALLVAPNGLNALGSSTRPIACGRSARPRRG